MPSSPSTPFVLAPPFKMLAVSVYWMGNRLPNVLEVRVIPAPGVKDAPTPVRFDFVLILARREETVSPASLVNETPLMANTPGFTVVAVAAKAVAIAPVVVWVAA